MNAVGLILTKYGSRTGEFGVRRALGASRADLLGQCLVESAVIGMAGGVLGLALTGIGLALERSILPPEMSGLAQLDGASILLTLAVAILATVVTGLYPALWASQVQPGAELKTQ
jgi:putative ABC transport system permease protein